MHKTAFNTWFGCLGFMTGDCTVQLSSEQTIALGIPMLLGLRFFDLNTIGGLMSVGLGNTGPIL